MTLKIAQLGQPVLRQVAADVSLEQIATPEFQQFLLDMLATLRDQKGAGLAAPQVFVGARIFLAAILPPLQEEAPPEVEVFINPRIVPLSADTANAWEGCLSFPELLVLVPRPVSVRVDYVNAMGQPVMRDLRDFPARVIQHEFDHLEGILTIDRAASTLDIIKASELETVREERGEQE
jgi:peptide deformylase